ncbi:MAG: hypothetical protein LUE92_07625 [Clostridiales bacterium]|nr:hypothetical protein [Clostridiales bacterium]
MAYMTLQYKSKAVLRPVTVQVILPTDGFSRETAKAPFKTLYFLNGYSAGAFETVSYLSLRKQCELKNIAIVLPEGDNSFYVDNKEENRNYASFVAEELLDVTRNLLPLSARREDTFIGGISMGGYGAIRNGLKNADAFAKIIALSPVPEPYKLLDCAPETMFSKKQFDGYFKSREYFETSDLSPAWMVETMDTASFPEIFIGIGKEDFLAYKQCINFAKLLTQKKVPLTYKEVDGGHEFHCWETLMDAAFSFLTGIPEGSCNTMDFMGL